MKPFSGFEDYQGDWEPSQETRPYPVELLVYAVDAIVKKQPSEVRPPRGADRGKIRGFSWKSCRRLIWLANNVELRTLFTFTMTRAAFLKNDFRHHQAALNAMLQRFRRNGWLYLWVREFQASGSLHWHIFTPWSCPSDGIDVGLSREWSGYFADQYSLTDRDNHYMRHGNGSDFLGCCRVERLKKPAGHYCGKEAGKRYQKQLPDGWSCRFWGASRELKPKLLGTRIVSSASLSLNDARTLHKLQFNKGSIDETYRDDLSIGLDNAARG